MPKFYYFLVSIALVFILGAFVVTQISSEDVAEFARVMTEANETPVSDEQDSGEIIGNVTYPISSFVQLVTKKNFGTFVSPEDSPVSPERFRGFHTGVDREVTNDEKLIDVPIYAIADGTLRLRRDASGYGGVVVIEHDIDGETFTAVYGHLRLSSIEHLVGERVGAGELIAALGTGFSDETGGERKHLHFAIYSGERLDLRGYVGSEAELLEWLDPIEFFTTHNAQIPSPDDGMIP